MKVTRRKILVTILFTILLAIIIIPTIIGYIGPSNEISTFNTFPRLRFRRPIQFVQQDVQGHVKNFVLEKAGIIKEFDDKLLTAKTTTFLDITDRVVETSEDGLLSLVFHPDFNHNGRLFTFHSEYQPDRYGVNCTVCFTTVLSEWHIDSSWSKVDKASQQELLLLNHTSAFHRAGELAFGPNGYLWVNIGDSTNGTNSQNLGNLFGSVLRIDVDSSQKPYAIPPDNPFVNVTGARPEIYAYGFRNPYRGSFDSKTGVYWVGDVGAEDYEEIDVVQKGANYGWPIFEGDHCRATENPQCADPANLTAPIFSYPHPEVATSDDKIVGNAVIGGIVYHGDRIKQLRGKYIFMDYTTGEIYAVEFSKTYDLVSVNQLTKIPNLVVGVNEGINHELYVVGYLDNFGVIYKIRGSGSLLFYGAILLYISALVMTVYLFRRKVNSKLDTQINTVN